MGKLRLFHEQTRAALRQSASETLVVMPVGATEQHGPHLPVGTDTYAIEHIARQAATQAAESIPVTVTPTLPFGSSDHHLPFGGTLSFGTETYYRVLYDLAQSLITSGFKHIFILNGHGGNHELVQLAVRDLALKHPVHMAAASYWTIAWDALVAEEAHLPGRLPGHAGAFESSVVLALQPHLVQEPRPHRDNVAGSDPRAFAQPYRAEHHGSWQGFDGYTDSPDRGDPERGRRYLAAVTGAVANTLVEFYQSCQP